MPSFYLGKIVLPMLLLSSSGWAQQQTRLSESFVKKATHLSLTLRGQRLTETEWNELLLKKRNNPQTSEDAHLTHLTAQYVTSPAFALIFTSHLSQWLRVNPPPFSYLRPDSHRNPRGGNRDEIFHNLSMNHFLNNKPWYQLLTSTDFQYSFSNDLAFPEFFGGLLSPKDQKQLESISPHLQRIPVADDDTRIAGILTTPSFFSRYPTNSTNINRKRAAALFRMLLCKNLVAAIPVETNYEQGEDPSLRFALMDADRATSDQILNHAKQGAALKDPHGHNPQCQFCHQQLDPLGQLFALSPGLLHHRSTPGRLDYYDAKNQWRSHKLSNIRELGVIVKDEPDYLACQVENIFKWTYGPQAILSPMDRDKFIQVFQRLQQKPQDFISFLVNRPQFYQNIHFSEDRRQVRNALTTLQKCQTCHEGQDHDYNIKFISWEQVMGNIQDPNHAKLRQRVGDRLSNKSMPPAEAQKAFSTEELRNLQQWSQQPDAKGLEVFNEK